MRTLKIAALLAAAVSLNALAFHSGGVAECNGCHTMHGSYEGAQVDQGENPVALPYLTTGPYLLKASDQSSACLNCHSGPTLSGYHVLTFPLPAVGAAPVNYTPGGDFAWLTKTYAWSPRSGANELSKGERKGHNVVAADFGLIADVALTKAPGGGLDGINGYPAASLHCSSCHDPHGKYRRDSSGVISTTGLPIIGSGSYASGSSAKDPTSWGAVGAYRILAGIGYEPKSTTGFAFANTVPAALVKSSQSYNVKESDTVINRVAYGAGMSEWCANCHDGIHLSEPYVSGQAGLRHPAGNDAKLPDFIIANYESYVKSGDLNGTAATSYSTLAPFEEGTTDYTVLKPLTGDVKTGPNAGQANVSCMSCHRAHATGWDSMLRFPLSADYMTAADGTGAPTFGDPAGPAGSDAIKVAMGRTAEEFSAALYGRTPASFAPYQRALCNKCHAKD